ncbi:hypothetical protein J3D54_005159 [Pseudomonas sp. GGS8]|uniref:BcsR/BcsP family cellulose biosynthesis protein n=1 Tax=Pseudomonas sp. GGS8 TaxID=2817892 RepID=UPI00345F9B0D|nr:hypothetical protein [Pseudomonas sp. GGS8]
MHSVDDDIKNLFSRFGASPDRYWDIGANHELTDEAKAVQSTSSNVTQKPENHRSPIPPPPLTLSQREH